MSQCTVQFLSEKGKMAEIFFYFQLGFTARDYLQEFTAMVSTSCRMGQMVSDPICLSISENNAHCQDKATILPFKIQNLVILINSPGLIFGLITAQS